MNEISTMSKYKIEIAFFDKTKSHFFQSCVPSGYCGGAYCAKNAVCLFDDIQSVQYCSCPGGFVGDGLKSCVSIPQPCNVRNNCGLNAQCVPANNGSFECACEAGYHGDGFICILEINCANTPSMCHERGHCISINSGYQCVCNTGNCRTSLIWKPWKID